jgi:hypothetical protein
MLHAPGGAGFATKSLLGRLVAHEPLAQYLQGNRAIDQQVGRAIDSAHAAATEYLIQPVFSFKNATYQRIELNISDRGVSLQWHVVVRTQNDIIRILATTSRALKHILIDEWFPGARCSLWPKRIQIR